jgi:hypothetical protein
MEAILKKIRGEICLVLVRRSLDGFAKKPFV